MSYIAAFIAHAAAACEGARPLGIQASVQLPDFALRLASERSSQFWRARFVGTMGGRLVYTDTCGPATLGFAGWLPYGPRQWKLATDKIAFKRHAIAQGVATPPACFDPARVGGPFIIKQAASSFGEGIRGPFVSYEPEDPAQQLAPGEYYENFILGLIAKAWCWGGECLALHLHKPSVVTRDGRSTIRELVEALPNTRGGVNDWGLVGRLAAYCGVASIDEALPAGKEVLVEFRYGSRYEALAIANPNVLAQIRGGALAAQFSEAARTFSQGIGLGPESGKSCCTLDAIVDGAGQAWFLEMNCNPIVHPDLYGRMIQDAFGFAGTELQLPAGEEAAPGAWTPAQQLTYSSDTAPPPRTAPP
jgi:hypothetical protein